VFELEERVMTTLYVAIEDISRPWEKKGKHWDSIYCITCLLFITEKL
jgi:hypothetical protein